MIGSHLQVIHLYTEGQDTIHAKDKLTVTTGICMLITFTAERVSKQVMVQNEEMLQLIMSHYIEDTGDASATVHCTGIIQQP